MNRIKATLTLFTTLILAGCHHGGYEPGPPTPPPAYPKSVATPIDPALQKDARAEIQTALHSTDEIIRAHALETVKDLRLTDANDDVVAALRDRSLLVRKAAALTAGELQIKAAADRLTELLQAEASSDDPMSALQERMAGIFALHRLGNTQYTHEFETTAKDQRQQIRREAAFLLGLLGEKSAVPILAKMLHDDKEANVRLEAGAALWQLGDERGEDALLAGTVSSYASDQMISLFALAQPHNTEVLGHVEGLFSSDYPQVRLVAARAAGMLGSDHGYGIAMQGSKSVDPGLKVLAAMAFGSIARADAQPFLAKALKDTNPDVRLAAAGALMNIAQKQ